MVGVRSDSSIRESSSNAVSVMAPLTGGPTFKPIIIHHYRNNDMAAADACRLHDVNPAPSSTTRSNLQRMTMAIFGDYAW
eukprot:scaffold4240_cov163-Amphora_coffeaeformis.AAC.12